MACAMIGEQEALEAKWAESQAHLRKCHLDFDVEKWYQWIKPLTFETEFLPLTYGQAQAILAHYDHQFRSRSVPDSFVLAELAALEKLIDATMQRMSRPGSPGFFVRLSTRSPKDAFVIDPGKYVRKLEALEGDEAFRAPVGSESKVQECYSNNRKMIALFDCLSDMCINTGRQTMYLLTTSERAFVDIKQATSSMQLYDDHPLQIVLRRWEPELDHTMEFRAFVNDCQLQAISQYNHYCAFPNVFRNQRYIADLLMEYWEREVKDMIPLSSYVVDFAILRASSDNPSVLTIELNPYASSTGGSLFDWLADREVLKSGPFEFRCHETPPAASATADMVLYMVEEAHSLAKDRDLLESRPPLWATPQRQRPICALQ